MIRKKSLKYLFIFVLISIGFILYYPALSGGFMMDDENSLSKLRIFNGEITFDKLKWYIGSAKTGPLYRPISVLSFLFDGTSWPTNPRSFKLTNLVIHLTNGVLLFILLFGIFSQSKKLKKDALFIAVVSTSLWMFHPFLVSTVMYVVQRMVLLSALFILLGLILYLKGRERYNLKQDRKSVILMISGMFIMPVLSVLSKENGILLVYFIALFEVLICQKFLGYKHLTKSLKTLIIYLPVSLLTLALLYKIPSFIESYRLRLFTLDERLFSQLRAITNYLYHIFVPKYFTQGVYTDSFTVSKGLFEPITAFYSLLLICTLFAVAWVKKKSLPLISFAIFFFFIAHSMESTLIPLELYYEHRNYIPMLFVFIPLVLGLNWMKSQGKIFLLVSVFIVIFVGLNTYLRTNIWGNNFRLHLITMNKYPYSVRARILTIIEYQKQGDVKKVFKLLEDGIKLTNSLDLRFNQLNLLCNYHLLKREYIDLLINEDLQLKLGRNQIVSYGQLVYNLLDNKCGIENNLNAAFQLVNYLEMNSFETSQEKKPLTYFFKAKLAYASENYLETKDLFIKSFEINHDYSNLFLIIDDFIKLKKYSYAQELYTIGLKQYEIDFKYSIDWFDYRKNFNELEKKLS
jgi:hypothetical protein